MSLIPITTGSATAIAETFPELRGKLNGHAVLALVWLASLVLLKKDLGKGKSKPKFRDLLSKSRAINILSAARLFLFGARDVWFVVALPVFLASRFGWDFWQVGGFLASWVIGYGIVQSVAPYFTGKRSGRVPDGRAAIALGLHSALLAQAVLIGGLLLAALISIGLPRHGAAART